MWDELFSSIVTFLFGLFFAFGGMSLFSDSGLFPRVDYWLHPWNWMARTVPWQKDVVDMQRKLGLVFLALGAWLIVISFITLLRL